MANLALSVLQDATINGAGTAVLRNTNLISCTIKGVEFRGCTISDSKLDKCQFSNCTIESSSILDSNLHVCKVVNCSMDSCSMTKSPLAFHKFPPEIRSMIFRYCIDVVDVDGPPKRVRRTPVLLIALRADKELYDEALRLFYKHNCFRVNLRNFDDCNLMSKKALENIIKVKITAHGRDERMQVGVLPDAFKHCKSIQKLVITPFNGDELQAWTKFGLERFTTLRNFTVWIPSLHLTAPSHSRSNWLVRTVINLGERLGAPPRQSSVRIDKWDTWFWEVPEGQTLKWKDD